MGADFGPPPAAIIDQKCNKLPRPLQIHTVEQRAPLPGRADQPRAVQIGQVVRQGILFEIKRFGDLGRAYTLRHVTHQQPEHRQPPGMAERGESGNGKIRIHIS